MRELRVLLMLAALISAGALACGIAAAQQLPALRQFTVVTTGPAEITLPFPHAPESPMLRDADRQWLPCELTYADGKATLVIPAEAGGRAVVLLERPEWLNLQDDAPPAVTGVSADAVGLEPVEGTADLGHLDAPPKVVAINLADKENPLDTGSLLVTLNGAPLSEEAGAYSVQKDDEAGKSLTLSVLLGDLPQDDYTLEVRITDASVDRWPVKLRVTFSTEPLVANGSFERAGDEKCPAKWSCGDWGSDAETKYEIARTEGGRTGDYCLMLHGRAGKLNVVCYQYVDLIAGQMYVLRGYHRGAGGGYASMISRAGGKDVQYLNMSRLPAVEEWTPFEWEFPVDEHESAMIVLRTTSKGQIYFDDVTLAAKE